MNKSLGAELVDAFGRFFKVHLRGDRFGRTATAIVIFLSVFLMFPISAGAQSDLSLTGLFRSYPLSGIVEAEGGYGIPLWGTPKSPMSGYIRPRLIGSSAATYNSVDAALEVFPIAFLGARAGGEGIQNDADYTAYDCEVYRCKGRYYRTYFEAELSLGAGPVFAQARWRRDRWSQRDPLAGDFVDPTSGLLMLASGDSQTVMYGVLGLNFSPAWTFMALLRYAETDFHEFSRTPVGMLRYKSGSFSIGLGAGTFESNLKKRDFTAQGFMRWEIKPSIGL